MANEWLDDLDEMTARYNNSFVSYADVKGILKPIEVHRFTEDDDGNAVIRDTDGNQHGPEKVNLDRPALGAFNVGKTVKYVSMPPVRQWRRGLVFKNLIVTDRLEHEGAIAGHRQANKHALVTGIYKAEYFSVEKALKEVSTFKALARAFSPKFYFGIRKNGSHIVVFYKKWVVGWVEGDVIKLRSHHLFEELSEFMKVEKV